jgi:predicted GIY-YIG superfamily endonuclease
MAGPPKLWRRKGRPWIVRFRKEKPMFYAYVFQSIPHPDSFYRGHTTDLKRRLTEHNAGKCPHTTKYMPWKLKFYAAFDTLELVQRFEKYLKSGSGHAFPKRHLDL